MFKRNLFFKIIFINDRKVTMHYIKTDITQTLDEQYLLETLNLDNKTILELGCGAATMTKKLAATGMNRKIIACEIDAIQHQKNLKLDIDNIEFVECGAQDIRLEDESVDMILMFKSFHHIPKELMSKALKQIKRVLKPNALCYISEPLFLGEQNELVAMFHDESIVRKDAFDAIKEAVEQEEFKLFREIFFNSEVNYESFEDFQKKQMNLTYNEDNANDELIQKVRDRYNEFASQQGSSGKTSFLKPFRVDILQKI